MCAGLFIAYLGSSLLLARMAAEAAKVRYDSSLLWTNKLDRCGTHKSPSHKHLALHVAGVNEEHMHAALVWAFACLVLRYSLQLLGVVLVLR